jgi:methyl-accepting chemotaxis protein
MKLNIGKKLLVSFTIVSLILVILGIISLFQMRSIANRAEYIAINTVPSIKAIDNVQILISQYRRKQLQHVISTTKFQMDDLEKNMLQIKEHTDDILKKYQSLLSDEKDRALLEQSQSTYKKYIDESELFIPLSRELKSEQAIALLNGPAKKILDELEFTIGKWSDYNDELGKNELINANNS